MKGVKCYDNGGKTFDRHTAVYQEPENGEYSYVGMSENPFFPLGFRQHGSSRIKPQGRHLGKLIPFSELPPDCQQLVRRDMGIE